MDKEVYRSSCCNAGIKTEGMSDFLDGNDVCTVHYVCLKCNNPCNLVSPIPEKSWVVEISVNDDIEIRLTKDGRKIFEKYRKTYGCHKSDILKAAQGSWHRITLWEFMNIFGSEMYMGGKNVIVHNKVRILKP
jgi:hypothetical protein